jgi:hypothetical protein
MRYIRFESRIRYRMETVDEYVARVERAANGWAVPSAQEKKSGIPVFFSFSHKLV